MFATSKGENHTCLITSTNAAQCWGQNSDGQLGDSSTTQRRTPVDVTGLTSGVQMISAGFNHTCAILTGGTIKCWGYNGDGELGDSTTTHRNAPVNVTGISSGATKVSGGQFGTCAVVSSAVKCWGDNSYRQVGNSTFEYSYGKAVDVIGLSSGISSMIKGIGVQNCVITTAGDLKCWGFNDSFNKAGGNISTAPEQVLVAPEDL